MERPYIRPYKRTVEEEKDKKSHVGKILFIMVTVMALIAVAAFSAVLYVKKEKAKKEATQEISTEQFRTAASAEWTDGMALLMYETETEEEEPTESDTEAVDNEQVPATEAVQEAEQAEVEHSYSGPSSSAVSRRVSPVSKSSDSDTESSTESSEKSTESASVTKSQSKTDSARTATSSSRSSSPYEYIMDTKEVKEQREYVPTIPLICAPEVGCDPMLAQDITNAMLDMPVRNYVELGEAGWQFILTLTPCKDRFNLSDNASTHIDYFTQVIYFDNTAKSYSFLFREIGHAVCALNDYPQMRSQFKDIFEEEGESLGYDASDDDSSAGDFFAEVYEGLVENPSTMRKLCPRASAFVGNYMD